LTNIIEIATFALDAVSWSHAIYTVLNAGRTSKIITVVKAKLRVTTFSEVVENPVILVFAGQTTSVIIAGLAIIGTVGAKILLESLTCILWEAHIQTKVVSAEII